MAWFMELRLAGLESVGAAVPVGTASPLAAPEALIELELLEDSLLDELLELDHDDDWLVGELLLELQVLVGGVQVEVGVVLVVGGGVHEEEEDAGALPPPLPSAKFQVPYRTPAPRSEKKLKRPSERSRPPYGQPGHYIEGMRQRRGKAKSLRN